MWNPPEITLHVFGVARSDRHFGPSYGYGCDVCLSTGSGFFCIVVSLFLPQESGEKIRSKYKRKPWGMNLKNSFTGSTLGRRSQEISPKFRIKFAFNHAVYLFDWLFDWSPLQCPKCNSVRGIRWTQVQIPVMPHFFLVFFLPILLLRISWYFRHVQNIKKTEKVLAPGGLNLRPPHS